MRSMNASDSSRVSGPGKCSITTGSALRAAKGALSPGRQRRRISRSVRRVSLFVGVGEQAFQGVGVAQRLHRLALESAHGLAVGTEALRDLVQRPLVAVDQPEAQLDHAPPPRIERVERSVDLRL